MPQILVVDDHDAIRKGVKLVLETYGKEDNFQALEARNGIEALEILKSHPIDLALVDLMMPEMDGLTLYQRMKESYPKIPVIILTAKADTETEAKVTSQLKPAQFLTKPIDNALLLEKVKQTLKAE